MTTDYDAIVIGAGHNGLTAAALLARKGQKVLCLEKNSSAGGMAITRKLFKDYKHNVGAWVLLVFRDEMIKLLELEKYNLELIRYKTTVKRFLTDGNKVTGVELRNGEKITSKFVLSSLDARTTFMKLAEDIPLPSDFSRSVNAINYKNGYLQIHLTLSELPEFKDHLAFANDNDIRWLMAYIRSPEHLQQCWEEYQRGEVPSDPVSYCGISSLMDPTLATGPGYTCTIFSHYFPYNIPDGKHNEYRDLMADRCIEKIAQYAPNFRDSIMDKAVLTHKYFESKFGITGGDFTHGLIQPSQWWDNRPVKGWSNYRTPLDNLYMCGASSHPGPGVTCIPGYNAANEVLKDLGIKVSTPNLTLDKPKKKLFFWRNSSGKV